MRRSNEVDVVAAHLLELDHGPSHVGEGDAVTPSQVTNIVILAEDAPEVTMGEKDGS